MAGEQGGGGVNVGGVYYTISADTRQLIEAERQADKSVNKISTKLTETAKASQTYAAAAGMAATAVREASKSNDAVAASTERAADAAKKAAKATGEQVMSAKALAAAQRNIPAQVTDIVTGLSTGQSPLTVLLQQGGQLKDMFGGVGNAAKALGSYVAGLVTPFTAAAAAGAALLFAWVKGRDEAAEFNRNILMTGNQSGVTASQLNGMAASLGNLSGITRGQAAEALNTFVQAGVAGEAKLGRFTEAAIRLERSGGQAVEKTAKAFADLQKDPLTASLKLNEATNYLTESVYRQIKSLMDQGKTAEAAAVAQNAYADAILQRAPKVEQNLGTIEKAWKAVADAARKGWDAILNVGREDAPQAKFAAVRAEIEKIQKLLDNGGFETTGGGAAVGLGMNGQDRRRNEAKLKALQAELLTLNRTALVQQEVATTEAQQKSAVEARAQFDKVRDKYLTDAVKMEREIAAVKELGRRGDMSELEIAQSIAAIKKSYADKGQKDTFDVAKYMNGLAQKVADEYEQIDLIETEALREAELKLGASNEGRARLEEARTLIQQNAAKQRSDLSMKVAGEEYERMLAQWKKEDEAAAKREADKKKGQDMAREIIGDADPITKLEMELAQKSELLLQASMRDQGNEELYAQARVALEQQTADKIKAIRDQQNAAQLQQQSAQLQAYGQLFEGIAGLTATFAGKQSGIYKAMFAVSKAFAIADAIIKIQQGIASAAALPFPANIPAMGSVVAATSSIVATIRGTNYGGGRQYGGPVDAGSMYRVGESNRPEMFVGDSGRSYMIPGERGKVVSNGDLGGSSPVTVLIENRGQDATATASASRGGNGELAIRVVLDAVADDMASGGKTARAVQSRFNLRA